jgi:hypothetical protein
MQRDRFYANGHDESDNDLITYSIKTGKETICVAMKGDEQTLLLPEETKELKSGTVHETEEYTFHFIEINRSRDLDWDKDSGDPILVVLKGGLWHGFTPINEGEGVTNMSRNRIKLRPVENTMICLAYRKNFNHKS